MSYNTLTREFAGQAAVGHTCWCGIQYAVPKALDTHYQRANEEKPGSFPIFCPLGHSGIPGGGPTPAQREAARLRDELAREKHRTEQARADAAYQRTRVTLKARQVAAKKGQITRMRNRIGNGVCPCCNRYFANLHRHMTGQHPDWTPGNAGDSFDMEPMAPTLVGTVIAARRRALGIDVSAAAAAIGVKASTVRMYESSGFSHLAARRTVAFLNRELAARADGAK